MGIDSSDYRFKEKQELDTILRIASNVYENIFEPKLKLVITSNDKEQIEKISKKLNQKIISCAIEFKTHELEKIKKELIEHKEKFRTLSISISNENDKSIGLTRLNYSEFEKDTNAYIQLPYEKENQLIMHLYSFLHSINQYSEFEPDGKDAIKILAENMYSLNKITKSSHKWKYETGCLEFEPNNNRKSEDSNSLRSIGGLKVQFSRVHYMAYKAEGIIKLSEIFIKNNKADIAEYNINSQTKVPIKILSKITAYDVTCHYYYQLNSVYSILELDWLLKDNNCVIELCDCKFHKDDEFEFSLYIDGNSIDDLDADLFIDYLSPSNYKNKVLNLFEGKMKHIGDG